MAAKKVSTTIKYVVPGTQPPIFLAGSFSTPEWQPAEMQYTTDDKNEHEFYREVEVEQGKEYQYKFRIGLGDWWILNEGSPTATDNVGNRNNILLIPHSEEQETTEDLKPETEKEEKKEETTEKPTESASYIPLVHESSPVLNPATPSSKTETTSTNENKYLRQFDGSFDGGQHAREALPVAIETLTPVTAPLSEDVYQKEPEPEISTEKGLQTERDAPEDTTEPSTIESVKESALEIKHGWFGQKGSTEAAQLGKHDSENTSSDFITGLTKDEEKRNSSHSNSSETSDPVNQSDHTDDSFVFVSQHGSTSLGGDSTSKEEDQSNTAKPIKHQTSKVKEENAAANAKSYRDEEVPSISIPAEDKSQDSTSEKSNDQTPQEIDNSDTSKFLVGLQQSLDGSTAPAAPLPVTPFVVGNRELGDDGGPIREVLSNGEGPSITVQPSTPGPASLSTIEPSKQLGDSASTAVDDSSSNQITKRNKQATPTSGRAASPSSLRTIPRDAKPNKGLIGAFLHLVFVEWIGKLLGKLWSGFKRQPSNEKLKIVVGCSVALVAYLVLYR